MSVLFHISGNFLTNGEGNVFDCSCNSNYTNWFLKGKLGLGREKNRRNDNAAVGNPRQSVGRAKGMNSAG